MKPKLSEAEAHANHMRLCEADRWESAAKKRCEVQKHFGFKRGFQGKRRAFQTEPNNKGEK